MMDSRMILFVVFLLVPASLANEQCPAASQISPCNCDGEGVNCMNINTEAEVRRVFQTKFPYDAVRGLWIQGTSLSSLSAGVFGNVALQQIYIEKNKITSIDHGVLPGSAKILTTCSFFGNNLSDFPFSDLKFLHRLMRFNLGQNQISSIPSDTFQNNPIMSEIILAQNRLSSIPSGLFRGLQILSRVDLSGNDLTTMGPGSLTFNSQANLLVFLNNNKINKIEPTAFGGTMPIALNVAFNKLTSLPPEPFGLLAQDMAKRGGQIEVSGNPLTCTGCDYYWIVSNKNALMYMLSGFRCTNGNTLPTLTLQDIRCYSLFKK